MCLFYDNKILWIFVQDLTAILGDQHQIFDADTKFSWEVNAWLDRENHAWTGDNIAVRSNRWFFMLLHADAVAGTEGDVLPVAAGLGELFCRRVQLSAPQAWF